MHDIGHIFKWNPHRQTPYKCNTSPLMNESIDNVLDENETSAFLQFDQSISINENRRPAVITESVYDKEIVDAEHDHIVENGSHVDKEGDTDKEGSLSEVEPAGYHDDNSEAMLY